MSKKASFKDTPEGKGVRTFLQNVLASVVGLVIAVWNVPGVPETVTKYAQDNFLPLLFTLAVMIGIPAGLIAFIQNRAGK